MKKSILVLVSVSAPLLFILALGCAHCPPCPSCPPEDAVVMITPQGEPGPVQPVIIRKGHFDDTESWAPLGDYEEWLKGLQGETRGQIHTKSD